jgi:PhnB protein
MPVNPVPHGGQPLMAHIVVRDAAAAIDFYKKVFAAEEIMRLPSEDNGKIMHAQLRISGCTLYLSDEFREGGNKSPQTLGGSPVTLTLYCLDADLVFNRAVKAGAKSVQPMQDAFWGDRCGRVKDPFGHEWALATHKEDLTVEQIRERAKKAMQRKVPAHA